MRRSSIVKDVDHCILCKRQPVEMHHVFYGKNHKACDRLNALVPLCNDHHTGAHGVHRDHELDQGLKQFAQRELLKTMSMKDFVEIFGRSYL